MARGVRKPFAPTFYKKLRRNPLEYITYKPVYYPFQAFEIFDAKRMGDALAVNVFLFLVESPEMCAKFER